MKKLILFALPTLITACSSLDQNSYVTDNGNEVIFSQFSPSSKLDCVETHETEYAEIPEVEPTSLFDDIEMLKYEQYVENAKIFSESAHLYQANYIEVTTIEEVSSSMNLTKEGDVKVSISKEGTTVKVESVTTFVKANYYRCKNI